MLDLLVCHLAWPLATVFSVWLICHAYVTTHRNNKAD